MDSKPKFEKLPLIKSLSSPESIWLTRFVLKPNEFLFASRPKKLKLKLVP